ncbi:MAG: Lrp/AsnC ligand binding domain-containing protein [Gammaproteobacteria bacterium]|nr:Lrp/AsnC ligand binding domain-containing protein [Gammaproteobacteria bacterium]MDD9959105.1 Lrp/AsnC ligand binding domain-containing protein [Gammaproteobacteria bacterium]
MSEIIELNKIDRKILQELQMDGRITYAELARRVGLSTSPCLERVRRMEREGIIRGYTTLLNPGCLGANLIVIVQIRLKRTSQNIFEKFKEAAVRLEEVQECYLISGNFDYLIKARVPDMEAYRQFLGSSLLSLPGVQESTSYVVMELVKETLNIPITETSAKL